MGWDSGGKDTGHEAHSHQDLRWQRGARPRGGHRRGDCVCDPLGRTTEHRRAGGDRDGRHHGGQQRHAHDRRGLRGALRRWSRSPSRRPRGPDRSRRGSGTSQAQGSGFVYDHERPRDHQRARRRRRRSPWRSRSRTAEGYDATIVGTDASTRFSPSWKPATSPASLLSVPLSLGDSSEVGVGDTVVAIGSPFRAWRTR